MFVIAYENSAKRLAYYAEHGFPWWSFDKENHPTRYATEHEAEKHADQLRQQRARAGRIIVLPA
ncbi:hypothetical protein [Oceanicola sp. S124]|uniref:hypothetical protein n=1 Tax=Oceanicola sp. S124 TaxID=1042378 RepID=UPI00110FA2B0|nr:hypothetical protein [Oceanicola sp. S124]